MRTKLPQEEHVEQDVEDIGRVVKEDARQKPLNLEMQKPCGDERKMLKNFQKCLAVSEPRYQRKKENTYVDEHKDSNYRGGRR